MANGKLNIPQTSTPVDVIVIDIALAVIVGILLYWIFGFLGVVILLVILAFTTQAYTQDTPEYHALTVLNSITGKQRVMFQGRNGKYLWEGPGTLVDLRAELKDIPEETWATAAGALMDAKYVFVLHPKATKEGVLAFASFTKDTVKAAARNLFTRMLSDHFGLCTDPKELLKKDNVDKIVFFETDPTTGNVIKDASGNDKKKAAILEFEEKYGVDSSAGLEDVDYDEETQKARDVISKAKSIAEALAELKKVMSDEKAELTIRQLNIPGIQEYVIDVKGIPNVRDINVIGGLGGKK